MRLRRVLVAAAAALTLGGCTGQTVDGSPSAVSSPARGGSTAGSAHRHPTPTKQAVTAFGRAWSWTSPVGSTSQLVNETASVVRDGTRAYVDSVTGDGLHLTTNRSYVTALDLRTGKQLWRIRLVGYVSHLQVVSGVLVLTYSRPVGTKRSAESLRGLDPASGRQRWEYRAPIEIPASDPPAVIGSSIYVNVRVSAFTAYTHRIDARTGRSIAQIRSVAFGEPFASDGLILLDNASVGLGALSADLRRYVYKRKLAVHRATTDRIVDGVLVRTDERDGLDTVYGHDPRTGRLLWTARLRWNDSGRHYSVTPTQMVIATSGKAVAIDARTGRTTWQVRTIGEGELGASGVADENVLACGRSLVSVDATTGRVFGATTLPSGSFEDGCDVPPVAADDLVLVASEKTVDAYRLTTTNNPRSASGDGSGAWGPADPELCGADANRSLAALKAVLGGRWRLYAVARTGPKKGNCTFVAGTTFASVQPVTAVQARHYFDRHNDDSICADYGADTGSKHRVSVAGAGLPKGSGGCYQTGLTYGSFKASDPIGGVTRTRSGQWVSVNYSVAHNRAVATHGPKHLVELLKRLAA